MKVGDSLICKKDYDYKYEGENYTFYKNNLYKIENIDDSITFENIYWSFFITNNNDDFTPYLWDYFYTQEELRQLKIESL